jgi:hypothetical protein
LKVDNNQSFPNNNAGAITPAILRAFNEDMIDSTVNQTTYTADSASWDASIDALTTFSASQHTLNATLATTGSNTFVGNQTIEGTLTISNGGLDIAITSEPLDTALKINNNLSVDGNLVADLPLGYVWLGGSDGRAQSVPSSSIAAGGSTDIGPLNTFTASQETKNATLATYTGSNDTKWNTIGTQSGSWVTESETGSFARTNITNTFTATQNIQGDLNITGTITANEIHTIIESSSVIFSSGSNILGDDPNTDTQTLNGATTINGDARLNGTTHQITGSIVQSGNTTITGSILSRGNNTFIGNQTITGTSKQTFNEPGDNQEVQVVKVNSFTDSNGYSLQNNTWGWYHYNSEGHEGFASQLYTGDYAYGSAFFHDPEKWEYILFPSGAAYDTNKFGLYDVGGTKTKFIAQADNIEFTGSVTLTPASVSTNASYPITFISGSTISKDSVDTLLYNPSQNALFVSASTGNSAIRTTGYTISSGSQSGNVGFTSISSVVELGQYIALSGNPAKIGAPSLAASTKPAILALSSSVYPVIEFQNSGSFTDGRATFKRRLVAEQSTEITGSLTASGSATITGQLKATFDQPANNNQVDNLKVNSWSDKYGYTIANSTLGWQRYEGTVEGWVQELYTGDYAYGSSVRHEPSQMTWEIYPSGSPYDSNLVTFKDNGNTTTTFKVLADTTEITGSASFKGSVFTSGSVRGNINTVTPDLNTTASFDFSKSNFFEVQLVGTATTHITATNVQAGQTINVRVQQGTLATGSVTFDPKFKFPAVAPYTPSQGVDDIDILTFVTFNNTNEIYAVAVKNMI